MRLLTVLLAVVLAAVLARPTEWQKRPHFRSIINPYPVERFHPYMDMEEISEIKPVPQLPARANYKPKTDWINKEIDHLNEVLPLPRGSVNKSISDRRSNEIQVPSNKIYRKTFPAPTTAMTVERALQLANPVEYIKAHIRNNLKGNNKDFANSPLDKKFFEKSVRATLKPTYPTPPLPVHSENKIPARDIRQNPNLSRNRNLVEGDIEKLHNQVTLPPVGEDIEVEQAKPPKRDVARNMYTTALFAGIGAAVSMAVVGFSFGWYRLSRRAKAAAEVDYPAYGVTGPTIDNSGDRKLAQSAHMTHYKHQKQQILAMERTGMEQRSGSVTDPESEEDNEEGDYTVYECPGFATTGDMEVKNPLFTDDTTPATPGHCEIVKPQPKE